MENTFVIVGVVIGCAICVGLAILSLRVLDWVLSPPKLTPEQREELERRYQQRLLQPQWSELYEHFGFDVRPVLEALYADHELLHRTSFYFVPREPEYPEEDHFIARFEPADAQTMKDTWFPIGENRFPFASDDFGNYLCVELAPDARDGPVLYADHDGCDGANGSDVSRVAASFTEFLSWETRTDDAKSS